MKIFRKVLCMILAVVMIAGIMPRVEAQAVDELYSGAVEHFNKNGTEAEIMSTTPSTVNSTQATQRINQLISKFEGKFFTVNGSRCTTGSHSSECSNCLMSSVVGTTWVKNLVGMGTLNYNLFPAQYDETGDKWSVNGWQCYGFANFAHWYIFAQKNTDNMVSTFIGKGSFTYNTLKSLGALPGDVLRTNWLGGHSMILISYDSAKVRVLDCNYKDSATTNDACKVQVHDVYFSTVSGKSVGITGVENYDRTAVQTYTVSYNANGGSGAPSSQTKIKDTTLKLSTQKPSRSGYTFLGWATSSSATSAQYQPGGSYTNNSSVTLYAVWKAQTYTISYDANGGYGAPSSQTKTHGVNLTLSSTVPYKSGYEFKGWQAPSIKGTDDWVTTKPSSGSYETGYKYYIYGYECDHCRDYGYDYDVDYTFYMGNDKNEVISTVKENPSVYGTYTPSKLRRFWRIETSYKGSDYYPGQVGSTYNYFSADYVAEDGTTGSLRIYKTHFYLESTVYRQSSSTGKVYQPGATYTENESVTFTAIWEAPTTYTVTYDNNGGRWAFDFNNDEDENGQIKKTAKVGESIELCSNGASPVRDDCLQWGWSTTKMSPYDSWYSGMPEPEYRYDEIYSGNKDITLYTVWIKSYTVWCNPNGGTFVVDGRTEDVGIGWTKYKGKTAIIAENISNVRRDGYTFLGWSTNPNATTAQYQSGDVYNKNVDIDLYAVWQKNAPVTYTISYNANGGSGAPAAQTKTHDVALTLSTQQPTRDGYTFIGWATSSSATSAQYQPGGSYTSNANVTLYAVWQMKDTNAPTITVATVNGSAGKEVTVGISIENNPGIAGMTFALDYDKTRIELVGYEDSGMKGWTIGVENAGASWAEIADYTDNGEILKLKFRVLDNAADGMAHIRIIELETFNSDEKEVKTVAASGGVNVINRFPGDINDDGKVDIRDAIRLAKYLAKENVEINLSNANVNGDDKVDVRDLIRLKKYLAKMPVTLV